MSKRFESGATKRKLKKQRDELVHKLPKVTDFFLSESSETTKESHGNKINDIEPWNDIGDEKSKNEELARSTSEIVEEDFAVCHIENVHGTYDSPSATVIKQSDISSGTLTMIFTTKNSIIVYFDTNAKVFNSSTSVSLILA